MGVKNDGYLLHLLVVVVILVFSKANAAEDQRCRCVCPKLKSIPSLNNTHLLVDGVDYADKAVYVKNNVEPEDCICEAILNYILPPKTTLYIDDIGKFCLRCVCKFEQRNSTTQKVVIIFVIVVFGLMFIYALLLMFLDPIMNKRRTRYTQQVNSLQEIPADQPHPTSSQASRRVSAAVNKVRATQEKWKGQVDEQRTNIYKKRRILA